MIKCLKSYKNIISCTSLANKLRNVKELNCASFNAVLIDIAISKLHNGKAAGINNLQKEHLVNAHPILYVALSKLFYLIFALGYVPNQFGKGILIPIQKDNSIKGIQKLENFRGITLSPLISKVFEHSILFLFGKYLKSNDRQFGFKEKLGCANAIFCVRNVVDYFVENDSTVNLCCLDISKAFDRVNHNCLFYKLLNLSVPLCVIHVLVNWYSKLFSSVRWGCANSDEFKISCGVRQGGVLSPSLFCTYVDNILSKLSKYGCRMNGTSYGSFMYADDLILLAPSVAELQLKVKVCCDELNAINLKLNTNKSYCIRIGKRFYAEGPKIRTDNGDIAWAKEAKYLGIVFESNRRFKISFTDMKCKFYASFNTLYSKLAHIPDLNVTIHLLESISVPILLYALEALNLNKSELNSLEFTFSKALYKIFRVSSTENLKFCMNAYNILNISERYIMRKNRFLSKLRTIDNVNLNNIEY